MGLTNLRVLQISHNVLTSIDHNACKFINKIQEVDFSYNELTMESTESPFSYIFFECIDIVDLNLAYNNISRVFQEWSTNGNLQKIDLEGNQITHIDAMDFYMLNHEAMLNLKNNKITTIELSDLEELANQFVEANKNTIKDTRVDLANNPLNCDCQVLHLVYYFENKLRKEVQQFIKFENKENIKCNSPPSFANVSVMNIKSEDLSCLVEPENNDNACNEICTCWDYPAKETLTIDCSYKNISTLPEGIINQDKKYIELNLSNNKFNEVPALHTLPSNLSLLDLSCNNLTSVNMDLSKISLRQLKLHDNKINRLQPMFISQLINDHQLENLTLHGNPWICDCEARDFLRLIQKKLAALELDEVKCGAKGKSFSVLTSNELCSNLIWIIISSCLIIATCGVVLGALLALYFKYQKELRIWLYAKGWCLWLVTEEELDKDKEYDAFISYSHKDEEFVFMEIVSKLEGVPNEYKLCLHCRDWVAGEYIPAQIINSVEQSRRTVVVLSPNFLESIWGRMEFRTAHSQALKERRSRVIVILYGDIGDVNNLDSELKAYLAMNTYVKWGDPWFWNKLRYALPHRYERAPKRPAKQNARAIANHVAAYQNPEIFASQNFSEVINMSITQTATKLHYGEEEDRKHISAS